MSISSRNSYFDFLRGFAIIMVVGIHTIVNESPGFETFEDICTILVRSILNCAVPLFLAISGFFVAKKNIYSAKEHLAFLKRQIPKVYIPCLIFSVPYFLLAIYSGSEGVLRPLASLFACGFSVYYFIALIIQYYALLPLFVKFNNSGGVILTLLISAVSIMAITYLMKVQDLNLPLLIYAGPFPLWIVFFFMGVYFSNRKRDYGILLPAIITGVGLVLQIIEYSFWFEMGKIALGIKLSSFIFSFGVIWLLFSKKIETKYADNLIMRCVNWIGGISFGVYLLHCYLIIIANSLFPGIGWIEKWTLVLSMTILLIWVARSIFPKFSVKYLGFR